jgi:hypothetical protein
MNNRLLLSIAFGAMCALPALPAYAQEAPTMNQPDNGFYEGRDPEWATLHSTSTQGTAAHRQYHRDAVKSHTQWHAEHASELGTAAYSAMHRIFHQERNLLHRLFHTTAAA